MKKKFFNKSEETPQVEEPVEAGTDAVTSGAEVSSDATAPNQGFVSKVAYSTIYAISYGVVFSSLFAAKLLIPKQSVVDLALHDGAAAARAALVEKERLADKVATQTEGAINGELPLPDPA